MVVTKTIYVCSVIEENLSRGLLNTFSLNVVLNIDYVMICLANLSNILKYTPYFFCCPVITSSGSFQEISVICMSKTITCNLIRKDSIAYLIIDV